MSNQLIVDNPKSCPDCREPMGCDEDGNPICQQCDEEEKLWRDDYFMQGVG